MGAGAFFSGRLAASALGGGHEPDPMSQEPQTPTPAKRVSDFERMAFGMFVHWGLYSQLGRGEWVQNVHKVPRDEYLKLVSTFSGKDFDAKKLVSVAKRAGMKYVTHTTRHHEGFSLYDTKGLSDLDVTHSAAPKRDFVREFVDECHKQGIVPMLYHTTLDWNDKRFESDWDGYHKYLRDSVELLCKRYGKIGGFWFDGNWSKPGADWHETELYGLIRRLQPEAIVINNSGIDAMGRGGHPEVDSVTFERGRPTPLDRKGANKYVAAEMCHTMNFHWGVAVNDFNYLSPAHVIEELCFARCAGANLLMNVGPEKHGRMPDYESAALARVGDWISLHGGAEGVIYHGTPCGVHGEGDDFALAVGDDLYLFVTQLSLTADTMVHTKPRGPGVRVFTGVKATFAKAAWLDNGEQLTFEQDDGAGKLNLRATAHPYGSNTVIRIAKLSR